MDPVFAKFDIHRPPGKSANSQPKELEEGQSFEIIFAPNQSAMVAVFQDYTGDIRTSCSQDTKECDKIVDQLLSELKIVHDGTVLEARPIEVGIRNIEGFSFLKVTSSLDHMLPPLQPTSYQFHYKSMERPPSSTFFSVTIADSHKLNHTVKFDLKDVVEGAHKAYLLSPVPFFEAGLGVSPKTFGAYKPFPGVFFGGLLIGLMGYRWAVSPLKSLKV